MALDLKFNRTFYTFVDTLFYPNLVYVLGVAILINHDPILDRIEFLRFSTPRLRRESRDRLICRFMK